MGIFKDLKEAKEAVFIPIEEFDLCHSFDSPEEPILDKLLEKNSDGEIGIYLYKLKGLTRREREAVGAASEEIKRIQKEYYAIVGSNSRKYQISEDEIHRVVTVELGSGTKKQTLSRLLDLAQLLDKDNDEQNKTAVNALTAIATSLGLSDAKSLDDAIEEEKKRNLLIVEKLGDDFTKLGELNDQNAEAQTNYNCELLAGILSSPLRVVALKDLSDTERKTFKVTAENVKNLSPGLVRTLFTEFVNKENQGKTGWLDTDNVITAKMKADSSFSLCGEQRLSLEEGVTYQVTAIRVEAPAEKSEGGKEPVKKSGKS
jgi:hypothetical protein